MVGGGEGKGRLPGLGCVYACLTRAHLPAYLPAHLPAHLSAYLLSVRLCADGDQLVGLVRLLWPCCERSAIPGKSPSRGEARARDA